MKRSYKVLSLLLTLALVFGLLPAVLPTVVEAEVKDTPAGVRNHLPSTAKDVVYLSDMNYEFSDNYPDANFKDRGYHFVKDGAWRTGKIWLGNGTSVAAGGTVFDKGLGVMPKNVKTASVAADRSNVSYTVFDLADNNYKQSFFYSAVGITNNRTNDTGVVFEVWASYDKTVEDYSQANYVLLEGSGTVKKTNVYQFHLDVTGARYLKLVVYAAADSISGMNCAWGGTCVYNNAGYYPKTEMISKCTGDGGEYEEFAERNPARTPSMFNAFEHHFNTYNFKKIPSNATMLGSRTINEKATNNNSVATGTSWYGGTHLPVTDSTGGTRAQDWMKDGIKVFTGNTISFNVRTSAASSGATDGYVIYDVSGLNADTFYCIVSATNQTYKYTDYNADNGSCGGLVFEVWGKGASDSDYRLLSESEPILKSNSGEFLVDITGVNLLKLRIRAKDPRTNAFGTGGFAYPCVFKDTMGVAVAGDVSAVKGTTAEYTATATRAFTKFYNYTGDIAWTVTGANGAGTKIENGKLTVDPAETATSLQVTASITEGNRTVTSEAVTVEVKEWDTSKVAYVGQNGYETLADAVAAAGEKPVTVMKDIALTEAVAIDKAVTLDLNDKTVSGATIATLGAGADLNVKGGSLEGKLALAADGAKLTTDCPIALELNGNDATVNAKNVTLTDSATDNGDVGGKVYGNITLANAVTKEGKISYVAIPGEDANGKYYTANAVRVAVTKVNVRPSAAGIYYTTEFKFNKNVVDAGATYGVVLSLEAKPGDDFMAGAKGEAWTVGAAPTAGENFISTGNSCLVKDIFKDTTPEENAARGAANIFANAYVKIGDTVIMAENTADVVYSMQTVMEALNTKFGQLDNGTAQKVVNFYKDWTTAMASWSVANIAEAAK